jgi:hypothetical protein
MIMIFNPPSAVLVIELPERGRHRLPSCLPATSKDSGSIVNGRSKEFKLSKGLRCGVV